MKRKIAAILAADVAEYSRLVAEDEEAALRQLVASLRVFRVSVEAHGGRIFNTAGDAILAEFQSAVEAVRSAVDIQHTLSAHNEASAPRRRMMFRMGISIGDVVENEGDLLGDGVNIAARLQGLSAPGGLAISKWVQEQVAGKVGIEFRDAGFQAVKNMPAPIHVFHSRIPAAVPAEVVPAARPVLLSTGGRQWLLRSLVAAMAVLAIGIGYLALTRYYPAPVATRELSPPLARQEEPAPLPVPAPEPAPASLQQSPPPAAPTQQETRVTPPEPSAASKTEPAAVETAPPASPPPTPAALPEPAPPASRDQPVIPAPSQPIEAAAPPPGPARQETAADPKRQKVRCAEVLERAQLGDLTSDDQAFLRSKCR
jgi:class 3 adenylate cyclase